MKTVEVDLNKYGPVINREATGEACYHDIINADPRENIVIVRMKSIVSMTTIRAKQIFGRIYRELGEEVFSKNIILDVTDGVYIIIEMGLEEMLSELEKEAR